MTEGYYSPGLVFEKPLFVYKDEFSGERKLLNIDELPKVILEDCLDVDRENFEEFVAFKYTIGSKTVWRGLEFIPAGATVSEEGEILDEKVFRVGKKVRKDERSLINTLYDVFESHFEKHRDETVVVPLSGGYDSRLIAFMTREFDLPNVILINYGQRDSKETDVSRKVARKLGFEWIFIEYSENLIKESFESVFNEFSRHPRNLVTTPHVQELPAFFYLKSNNILPDRSVVFPGHTGDFISGGHLKHAKNLKSFSQLVKAVIGYHSQVFPVDAKVKKSVEEYLRTILKRYNVDFQDAFEIFDWRERQAKYIVNSVAVYEFFGYGWDIPLWDEKLFDFFSNLSNEQRYGQVLYKSALRKMFEKYGIDFEEADTGTNKFRIIMRNLIPPSYTSIAKALEAVLTKRGRRNRLFGDFDFSRIVHRTQKKSKIAVETAYYVSILHLENLMNLCRGR